MRLISTSIIYAYYNIPIFVSICFCFQRGTFVSEPAILVKRIGLPSQAWTVEKFENKIVDMREMYQERKERGLPMQVVQCDGNDSVDPLPVVYVVCA